MNTYENAKKKIKRMAAGYLKADVNGSDYQKALEEGQALGYVAALWDADAITAEQCEWLTESFYETVKQGA